MTIFMVQRAELSLCFVYASADIDICASANTKRWKVKGQRKENERRDGGTTGKKMQNGEGKGRERGDLTSFAKQYLEH